MEDVKQEEKSDSIGDDNQEMEGDTEMVDDQKTEKEEKIKTKDANVEKQKQEMDENVRASLSQLKNVFEKLFVGKEREIIKEKGKRQETDKYEVTGIILRTEHQDLETAWDAEYEYESQIDKDGHPTSIHQKIILDLPKILKFGIDRTDRVDGHQIKNNNAFEFDPIIYPDRFLR